MEVNSLRLRWKLSSKGNGQRTDRPEGYSAFQEAVRETKRKLLTLLIEEKRLGSQIVGYGAAAKGNTLLNYCGVGTDFIEYAVDRNPLKQGKLLPGTRIPVRSPDPHPAIPRPRDCLAPCVELARTR